MVLKQFTLWNRHLKYCNQSSPPPPLVNKCLFKATYCFQGMDFIVQYYMAHVCWRTLDPFKIEGTKKIFSKFTENKWAIVVMLRHTHHFHGLYFLVYHWQSHLVWCEVLISNVAGFRHAGFCFEAFVKLEVLENCCSNNYNCNWFVFSVSFFLDNAWHPQTNKAQQALVV